MLENKDCVLVSINFELSKGGVSRVAHLMHSAIKPPLTLSLYGSSANNTRSIKYFNKNIFNFWFTLVKIIVLRRPNMLMFDHIGPCSLLAVIPKLFLHKVIVFLHDEEAWSKVRFRHKLGLLKASHILCNSNYTYQRFVNSNPEFKHQSNVCLLAGVPHSFELNNEVEQPKPILDWIMQAQPYLIFVSRLWSSHRYKGYMELIKAMALALQKSQFMNCRLAIVGSGDDENAVIEEIQKLQLDKHVKLFNNVDDDVLKSLYQSSMALIFPSTREGFGFVFLEAMYFGKACIGIRGQPAEEILNADSGVLLNDNELENLSNIILDISKNQDKYIKMGIEGRNIYLKNFTNQHFNERFIRIIDN